ncbi:hypothetical protein [Shewanella sp. CG12_big_fil_rev_8_21_14_0_65_47_15]|uniref:hypothetical protein n=1 Tax=Shewanella sp. CG12_big_fil_rev_8_21_14_0_65_47_15 TaxID=1975537 RepID=UPI0025FB875B|nr:hypothetical protein [Shewanella sp. CG12_big_fil_rev_8_21_14_0_65_47_15]
MHKLVEMFFDVDDFCAVFIPEWEKTLLTDGTRKRQRAGRMTMSEVMTILILFQMFHHLISKTSRPAFWLISINQLSQIYSAIPALLK